MNNSFAEIYAALSAAKRIAVACHVRPDGDAIGSIIAFAQSWRLAGKEVRMFSEDGVPQNLAFLPLSEQVEKSNGDPIDVDVVVALDTAVKNRLGERTLSTWQNVPLWINMDHHGTNPRYGHLNYIDVASPATGQIIYDFFQAQALPMDSVVRQNVFAAISTDTGSFQYSNTTGHTHRIIAEMMDAGEDFSPLCQNLYQTQPKRKLDLLRALLNELKVSDNGLIVSWAMTLELQKAVAMQDGDSEGLIDTLRTIEGTIGAVIFEELPDGKIRVSARSKDQRLDVSKVCAHFGGGGHRMAAGARLPGPLADAEKRFLDELENEIKRIA